MGPAGTQTDNLETEIMTVDMVTHIYNPSIQESETRGPEIQSQSGQRETLPSNTEKQHSNQSQTKPSLLEHPGPHRDPEITYKI